MRVMTAWFWIPVLLAGCCGPLGRQHMTQTDAEEVANLVLQMERAALDRWCQGDPSGFLEVTAPEVVYFDPEQARRVNGIEELMALFEGIRGKVRVDRYELLNPTVQVSGNAAVLTYNYVAHAGGRAHLWNCTEVYCRRGKAWWITQTHWSVTQPFKKAS
ncbi:MAG: nuclear transport factor 2 family protein [Phycisphaerae bacterium]|nr:nuclear transport factor 2 family protein [Phycisphaerae bacterium]